MIPREWASRARPRDHELWVKRDEEAVRAVGIVIPDHLRHRLSTHFPIATVWAVGAAIKDLKPGDRVLIRPSAGRLIRFGERGELVLRVLKPGMVLADVLTSDAVRISLDEHQFRGYHVPQELVVEAE